MPTIAELVLARKAALRDIDVTKVEAARRRRESTSGATKRKMKDISDELSAEGARLGVAFVQQMDDSEEMRQALAKLAEVSQTVEAEALKMKKIGDFLSAGSAVADAVKKFTDALTKDPQGQPEPANA